MDIDLLVSKNGDVGLVSTGKLPATVMGVIFDRATTSLSLEFGEEHESLTLNVPVGYDLIPYLVQKKKIFIIGSDKHHIHESYRVPLMHTNMYDEEENIAEWR